MTTRWDRNRDERRRALRGMPVATSIRIGESLLTSDLMRLAWRRRSPRPIGLAVALGLRSPKPRRRRSK